MASSLNIVELIENNPITRLSSTYQDKLLNKIKSSFTDNEQQLFVASFYCYLNYNSKTDFVIDLDDVWKWLGFSQKYNAKHMLEKHFIIDTEYKIFAPEPSGAKKDARGGHNKETIMLTIRTFKLFCLKAGTKKAEQIHEYYIKLEETLQDVVNEESNELKLQLERKTTELNNHIIISMNEKELIREKTLIEQFHNNTQCVYYGIIDNLSTNNEKLVKFGNSNNLKQRVKQHKDTYLNFRLVNAFKVENKLQIENAIKEHSFFSQKQRTITLRDKKYVELLNIEDVSFSDIDNVIKDIITRIEYSPDNYIKLLTENKLLKAKLLQEKLLHDKLLQEKLLHDTLLKDKLLKDKLKNINITNDLTLLRSENNRIKMENLTLIKKYNDLKHKTKDDGDNDIITYDDLSSDSQPQYVSTQEVANYGNVITTLKKNIKNKQGVYHINGVDYKILEGTRQEVWDGIAYQTAGVLHKRDLIINKSGKIVSKKKYIQETINNKFLKSGIIKPKCKPDTEVTPSI